MPNDIGALLADQESRVYQNLVYQSQLVDINATSQRNTEFIATKGTLDKDNHDALMRLIQNFRTNA